MAKSEHYTKLNGFKINKDFMKRLITPKNYAVAVGVTPKCIYGRIKKGTLQNCIIGGVIFVVKSPII